jgi:hypothetical protein
MLSNGNNGVLVTLCKQNPAEIIRSGGIIMPSPRVNRQRVETMIKYIVCCTEAHGNAFLIGTVDKVIWVNDECVIKINSYASINRLQVWADVGTKIGFAYLQSPSQIHMHVGRLKFTNINGNGKYGDSNSYTDDYLAKREAENSTAKAQASVIEPTETKKSAIVVYPKPKQELVSHVDRIATLRKQLAELESNRNAIAKELIAKLHDRVTQMDDTQVERVIAFCERMLDETA